MSLPFTQFLQQSNVSLDKLPRVSWYYTARIARVLYEHMRQEDASIRIQKHARALAARRSYTRLQEAAVVIQTGLRTMAARNEFRRRRQNKGATIIQVIFETIVLDWTIYEAISKSTCFAFCRRNGEVSTAFLRINGSRRPAFHFSACGELGSRGRSYGS